MNSQHRPSTNIEGQTRSGTEEPWLERSAQIAPRGNATSAPFGYMLCVSDAGGLPWLQKEKIRTQSIPLRLSAK